MKKKGIILLMIMVLMVAAGCSNQVEEAEQEIVWETLPPEEQGIEVTVSDIAREHMATDWEEKYSQRALFMLIPGSS